MFDENRIKKAETNIRTYLADGLLKKETFKEIVYNTYLKNHQESINLADKIFNEEDSNLWTVVISYYSMFYIANAVLYRLGYKTGDKIAHKITADALIVYVRNKLAKNILLEYEEESEKALAISDNLIESFDYERGKRSRLQYETTEEIKKNQAKTSLERAKSFALEMDKLLKKLK